MAGTVTLGIPYTTHPGTLTTAGLVLASTGVVSGAGTIVGPVSGTGTVTAANSLLVLESAGSPSLQVSGYGTIELTSGGGGTATFENPGTPVLQLDNPASFTATIIGFETTAYATGYTGAHVDLLYLSPDQIVLPGVSLSSVSNESYAQDAQGGTLTFQIGTATIALRFAGQYQLSDFALSAGPQAYSNSAPSLVITDPTIALTRTAPTLEAYSDTDARSIFGTQNNSVVALGDSNDTITLLGTGETITLVPEHSPIPGFTNGPGNNVILGSQGSSTITLGDGNQVVVAFGSFNTIAIGNAVGSPSLLGAFSFVDVSGSHQTISAGNGTNIIETAGYGDTITTGNGLNLIFATDLAATTPAPAFGPAGYTTLTLGTGNNFAYLHGASNRIVEGGGVDAIWGGTGGGDTFVLNAVGGTLFVENFGAGDTLDLTKILDGVPFASDLSNIARSVSVVATGADDMVFGVADGGSKTVLQVTGGSGTAFVNLENVGSLTVSALMTNGALILPAR